MEKIIQSFQYGTHSCTLETGHVARQANAAVLVSIEDVRLLVTVVIGQKADVNFLPLTVHYQEKTYAVGKIPGGFFKREGRPSERETLISRLIDRSVRPLFPKYFTHEVQIIATLLSFDPDIPVDVPAIIGASAALAISGIPFNDPLAATRVAYCNNDYVLHPSSSQLSTSSLDLVVAGTEGALLMVESEANQLSEEVMLEALFIAHGESQVAIKAIKAFANEVKIPTWDWVPAEKEKSILESKVKAEYEDQIREAYQISEKQERMASLQTIREAAVEQLSQEGGEVCFSADIISSTIHDLEKVIVRRQILDGKPRIDGRTTEDIRSITPEVGILPRAHGSALFTRGETQALVICTLGTERDAQLVDSLAGEYRENFMLHYNFPPYCVGEIGSLGGPKRREIGHGKLAKRALNAAMPSLDQFPYVIRIVSEITESNGSSSMASVCGGTLALMDAGIPLKEPVAGIAMGLIKEGNKYAILSDILGDEDHLGDMDFKVAGTQHGVTALQMDIKIDGINREIMTNALNQAKQGRLYILDKMLEVIQSPRDTVSKHAPRIATIKIRPDKIREVIGKGGATIRELTEQTRATIDIGDDGLIKISGMNRKDVAEAIQRIEELTAEPEVGKVYSGKVIKIVDFGAFVEVLPGRQGLLHISQIADQRVENVRDYLREGETIDVKIVDIDNQGRVRLTRKGL